MKRKHLTRLQRIMIFDEAKGICCICDREIKPGEHWICEHVKPLWLGGADDASNMRPAHEHCGIEKTCGEAPVKAKNDRVRANHLGIKRKSKGRPLPGTRASGIRKRMDGTVERW